MRLLVGGLGAEELGVPADDVDRSPQVVREVTDGGGWEQTPRRGFRHRSISIH